MALVDLLQVTEPGDGVNIPLAWLLATATSTVGAVFVAVRVLLKRIDDMHTARLTDRDATIAALTKRIERYEAKEDEARRNVDTTISLLERSVTANELAMETVKAINEQERTSGRRARNGD